MFHSPRAQYRRYHAIGIPQTLAVSSQKSHVVNVISISEDSTLLRDDSMLTDFRKNDNKPIECI